MNDHPLVGAEGGFVAALIAGIHKTSSRGFDAAWTAWKAASPELREAVDRVYNAWLPTVDQAMIPSDADPDLFRVQILNVPGRWEGVEDLVSHLRYVARVEPPWPGFPSEPTRKPWQFCRWGRFSWDAPQNVWEGLYTALVNSVDWGLCLPAWTTLTPAVRAMVARQVGDVPASLGSPEAMAWLDREAARPRTPDYLIHRALRALLAAEASELAGRLIDQQIAWRNAGLIPKEGCVPKMDGIGFYFLANLRAFHGPLDRSLEPRARPLELAIFDLFGTYDRDENGPMWDECEYFNAGVALVSPSDPLAKPMFARAGHGERLTVNDSVAPLIVILDIDLTHPELAFLGLKGTRLRVCDWADHGPGELCFTRVGLDGTVTLRTLARESEVSNACEPIHTALVPGPAFYSDLDGEDDGPGWHSFSSRIGGGPGWEQEPDVPVSPVNGDPMTFIAQLPHPNGGTAFVFLDPINLIATVMTQWD